MTGDGQPPTQQFHHRLADLLDDVTVNAEQDEPDTSSVVSPSAAASADSAPAARAAPVIPPQPSTLPGKDETALPPFLRQPLPSEKSSSLPGASIFAPPHQAAPKTLPGAQPAPAADADATVTTAVPALAAATAPQPSADTGAEPSSGAESAPPPSSEDGAPPATVPAMAPAGPPISIRGRSDGLVVEIGKGSWSEILAALDERLQQSASFFRNARVALDLGARATTEAELTPLLDLFQTHELTLGSVRTSTERTFQAALALGLTSTLESAEGTPVADAAPATTNTTVGAYFVYRGYLRSGHRLQRKESVLVIGDVNPGAEVSSDGDVLVWGRLRGVVHAGAKGNVRAIVAALDLEPTQLRIADVMTIGADPRPGQPGKWFWRRSANKRAEIARIVNETISIEEWDAARPGGIVSLRRGG